MPILANLWRYILYQIFKGRIDPPSVRKGWAYALIAWYFSSFFTPVNSVWGQSPSFTSWCLNDPIVREPTTIPIVVMFHQGCLFPKFASNSKYLSIFCASLSISSISHINDPSVVSGLIKQDYVRPPCLNWQVLVWSHRFCISCTVVFASFNLYQNPHTWVQSSHDCIMSSLYCPHLYRSHDDNNALHCVLLPAD